MPTITDFSEKLAGKKYFTVMKGFHQILLDEEPSWKCCFATEYGVYKYLRLPYGVACSSEIFQMYEGESNENRKIFFKFNLLNESGTQLYHFST
jgi:hypothetical protein